MTSNNSGKSFPKDQNPGNAPNSIIASCIRFLTEWAVWMQRTSRRLSLKTKIVMLLLFCLLAGSFSIYLIADSLLGRQANRTVKITPIKHPGYAKLSGNERTEASIVIDQREYQKIHRFRLYIDSLANTASGKRIRDSIFKQRPGLMDSIEFIENIYQSQNKN